MGLDTIGAIMFGVIVILLTVAKTVVIAGRANGVSLRPPRWLERFILDASHSH
jgi:hypothetical protein